MQKGLRFHWPEYLMEAGLLAAFMFCACLVTAALEHPGSPLREALPNGHLRRGIAGGAMGLTAICLFYSPWGKQSGAHLNPAVTLTFWRLGKVRPLDAAGYVLAQLAGGMLGVMAAAALAGEALADRSVSYAATVPGEAGAAAAFLAESIISFGMMSLVLNLTAHRTLAPYTPLFAGALIAAYILVEAPLSGMSMNPARSLGSALPAGLLEPLWIYFTAPLLGMLLAADLFARGRSVSETGCAKLHHRNPYRCIFCGKPRTEAPAPSTPAEVPGRRGAAKEPTAR